MKTLKRTWADVSMDDLEHNYNAIMGHIPSGCRFLGVIKADAYGHGAVPVSQARPISPSPIWKRPFRSAARASARRS